MWLSDDMARALAATCPPLEHADIVRAADELAIARDPAQVTTDLFRRSYDLIAARQIAEALLALQTVGVRANVN